MRARRATFRPPIRRRPISGYTVLVVSLLCVIAALVLIGGYFGQRIAGA